MIQTLQPQHPVIRIFGPRWYDDTVGFDIEQHMQRRQTCCVHVHGVYPYFYVEVPTTLLNRFFSVTINKTLQDTIRVCERQKFIHTFVCSLEKALVREQIKFGSLSTRSLYP